MTQQKPTVERPDAARQQVDPGRLPVDVPVSRTRSDLLLFAALTVLVTGVPLLVAGMLGPISEFPARTWFIVGTSGPTLAALVLWVAGRRRRRDGSGPVVRAVPRWGVTSIVLGVVPTVAASAVGAALGGPVDLGRAARVIGEAGGPLLALALFLAAGPLAEEFGWRGYAQPRLRRLLSPVATSVVLGIGWAAWHLPLFYLDGTSQASMGLGSPQATLFFLSCLPMTYLLWYVSERLRGGVAAAVLLHLAFNSAQTLLGDERLLTACVSTAVVTVLAIAVHHRERRRG